MDNPGEEGQAAGAEVQEDKLLDMPVEKKSASPIKLIIILGLVFILVLCLSAGIAFYLLKGKSEVGDDTKEEVATETPAAVEHKQGAEYLTLKPPFIIKSENAGRKIYLQMELTLVTRDAKKLEELRQAVPQMRNAVVTLMGSQVLEELRVPEGREALQKEILADLQNLLEEDLGDPMIDQVLFTTFVMQ